MFQKKFKRLITIILTVMMLVSAIPVMAYGEESTPAPSAEVQAEPTPSPSTEPAADPTPAPSVSAEPTPAPSASAEPSAEPTEAAIAEVTDSDYTMETYGFPGLPESYTMNSKQMDAKLAMATTGEASQVTKMIPGTDYVDGELFVTAGSEAEAEILAAAYNAEVKYYFAPVGIAMIVLSGDATTIQAMTAAADISTRLPALSVNEIIKVEPIHLDAPQGKTSEYSVACEVLPENAWASQKTDDPFISDPNNIQHLLTRYTDITEGYQYAHDMVGTYNAWLLTKGSTDVNVFIIDTGVYAAHEDFSSTQISDITTLTGTSSTSGAHMEAHGTHVAGIIAATADNGLGGTGVAPGVTIQAYRCDTDSAPGSLSTAAIIDGLGEAITNDAYVVNMSLGGSYYNSAFDDAVQDVINAGIAVFASEGNDGVQAYNYPAHYNGVISVASTDNTNSRSFYSTYAKATISAPGSNILSLAWDDTTPSANTYQSYDGTSMACPVAVGCAALYYSARGTKDLNGDGFYTRADVDYLRTVLTKNVTAINGVSTGMGTGVINIEKVFYSFADKPVLTLSAASTTKVSTDDTVTVTTGWNGQKIIYTVDGKTPVYKNGQVVYGTAVTGTKVTSTTGAISYTYKISLTGLALGTRSVSAICVNSEGKASAVTKISFTVDDTTPTTFAITTSTNFLAVGKSFTFKGTSNPPSTAKPTWSIVSGGEYATIAAATGVMKALAEGTVVIRATLPGGIESDPVTVNIVPLAAGSMVFAEKLSTLYVGDGLVKNPTVKLTDGSTLMTGRTYQYTSSNASIASVDSRTGEVSANKPGTATITSKILDGSSKSATYTVKVLQSVTAVAITGYVKDSGGDAHIVAGKSLALKANISPSDASAKNVKWELAAGAPAGVTISAAGNLFVPAAVTSGNFTVICTALDTSAGTQTDSVNFTIDATALSAITLDSADSRVKRNLAGAVISASIFTVDVPETAANDTQLQLTTNAGTLPVYWSSSNTSIMTVDQTGFVTCVGKGSATITAALLDGSGKKVTAKFTGVIPASNINVSTNADKLKLPYPTIAFGRSRTFKATIGSTYGTPSNKKVTWSYELREYNYTGALDYSDYVYDMENSAYYRTLSDSSYTQYVKISSGGVVSVAAGLKNAWNIVLGEYYVKIIATATDGSGVVGFTYAQLAPLAAAGAIRTMGTFYYFDEYDNLYYVRTGLASTTSLLARQTDTTYTGTIFFYGSSWNGDFGITSSNPAAVSPFDDIQPFLYGGHTTYYLVGNTLYPIFYFHVKADNPGSANITVFTNDGTNKKASFPITVK